MTGTTVTHYQAPGPPSDQELAYMERLSAVLARTGMIPEYFRNKPDDILIAGLGLRSLNLPLDVNTLCEVYVVKGKPGYMAQLQIGLARRAGIDIRFDQEKVTAESATVEIRDRTGWHSVTFTMADAVKGGLTSNDCYRKFPDRMLFARAVTKAIAAYASHVKLGIDIDGPGSFDDHQIVPEPPSGIDVDAGPGTPDIERPGPASATKLERQLLWSLIDQLDGPGRDRLRTAAKEAGLPNIESHHFTSDSGHQLLLLIGQVKAEPSDTAAVTPAVSAEAANGSGPVEGPGHEAADDDPGRTF